VRSNKVLIAFAALNIMASPYIKDVIKPEINSLLIAPKHPDIGQTVTVLCEAQDQNWLKEIKVGYKYDDTGYKELPEGTLDSSDYTKYFQRRAWRIQFKDSGIYNIQVRAYDAENNIDFKTETIYVGMK